MDVVYYVRPGERNEELRYSLRSLSNVRHDKVWIVGHKPAWVHGVEYVKGNDAKGRPELKAMHNLQRACDAVDAPRFVVMNDDMYVMRPLEYVPALHDGPLTERIESAAGYYKRQLIAALDVMRGWSHDLIAWTLHIPFLVDRLKLRQALAIVMSTAYRYLPEWRSVYGNLWSLRGERAADVKIRSRRDTIPAGPFLSSSDSTFPIVRPVLQAAFPEPGPYEL